jgi:hypothetical protein
MMGYPGIGSPSSAGYCQQCGEWAEKRYGGEGKYLVMCWDCWAIPDEEFFGAPDDAKEDK